LLAAENRTNKMELETAIKETEPTTSANFLEA